MITAHEIGDITGNTNRRDIIIAMNTELGEASAIGRPFVKKIIPLGLLDLGSVLTFQFDEQRLLHMLICHHLGKGGWRRADQFVRYGMDYLWQRPESGHRFYSIVQVGNGPVGQRDEADYPAIINAISDSFLPVILYIRGGQYQDGTKTLVAEATEPRPLVFLEGWSSKLGVLNPLN